MLAAQRRSFGHGGEDADLSTVIVSQSEPGSAILVDEDVERRDATVEERQETTVLPALIVLVIGVLGAEVGGPALGEHLLTKGGDAGVGDGVDPAAQVALPNGIGQQVGGDGR